MHWHTSVYWHPFWYWHPFYWHPFGFWHPLSLSGLVSAFGGWFLIATAVWVAIYFLPTIIARTRDVASSGGLFWINLLFGWTMIGWVLCLFWGLLGQTRAQITYRGYAAYPPPPYRRGWF